MELESTLQEIGLEEREIKVYLALLELDESTVLPIATKAGVKRTYTYDILSDLIKKGLVTYVEKNGRRRYIAEDPKQLDTMLKERLQRFHEVLPELKSLYNRNANKPKVRFFEGKEQVATLYDELGEATEYASLASPDHFYELLGTEYLDKLTTKIVRKKIKVRELFAHSYSEVHFEKQYTKGVQEVRLLPAEVEIDTDMLIFTHKKMFDLLWAATPSMKNTAKGADRA